MDVSTKINRSNIFWEGKKQDAPLVTMRYGNVFHNRMFRANDHLLKKGLEITPDIIHVEDYMAARMKVFAARYGLTKREAEVCTHLTRGHTAKSVSEALGISENTAWTHIRNVYSKCGVKTKSEFIDLFERSEGDGPVS